MEVNIAFIRIGAMGRPLSSIQNRINPLDTFIPDRSKSVKKPFEQKLQVIIMI